MRLASSLWSLGLFVALLFVAAWARTHDLYYFAGNLGFVAFGGFVIAFMATR
jgi:hypothetical protein